MRETVNKTLRKRIGGAMPKARSVGLAGLVLVLAGPGAMAQSGNPFKRLLGLEPEREAQTAQLEQAAPQPQSAAPAPRPTAQPSPPPVPPRRPAAVRQTAPALKPEQPKAATVRTPFGTVYRPLGSTEFVPFSQPEPMQLQPRPLADKEDAPDSAPVPEQPQPQPVPAPAATGQSPAAAPSPVAIPLPPPAPRRPAQNEAAADPAGMPPQNAQGTTVPPPAALPPVSTLTDRQIVDRANRYFNTTDTLQASFTQLAGGSQRTTGTLYLERPGRIRFAYNPPSTMEIISDGKNVAIRDSKLNTSDVYPVNQTPLKFLLRDPINLGTDLKVVEIERDPTSIQITLEDSSTIGGKARITLYFDPQVQNLTRWQIVDAQGFLTTVILSQVKRAKREG